MAVASLGPVAVSLNGNDWRMRGFLGEEWRWAHLERTHPEWLPARVPGVCPRIIHQGIWDDAWLRITEPIRLEDLFVRPRLAADQRSADLQVGARLDADRPGSVEVAATVLREGRRVAHDRSVVEVSKAQSTLEIGLSLQAPELWWPNGAGHQPLYELEVEVAVDGPRSDRVTTRFGIRSVELIANETPDATARLSERRYLFSATADLAPMLRMPVTDVYVSCADDASDGWSVTLRNVGERLPLLVHLEDARPLDAAGWPETGDDLVTLLRGEERRVAVAWPGVAPAERRLRVAGWNTAETLLA